VPDDQAKTSTDAPQENAVAECVLFLAQQFEGAITATLGQFIEKMKKEPIWANSVLTGLQQIEVAAPMDPASVLLIYQAVLATCKEFGTCRRCKGKEKVRVRGAKVACPVCAVLPKGLTSGGNGNGNGAEASQAEEGSGEGRLRPGGNHRPGAGHESGGGGHVIIP
jgi:hypothetical protein